MKKYSYYKAPLGRPYLLENIEEKKVIHQYNTKGQETDLENLKSKCLLNEMR